MRQQVLGRALKRGRYKDVWRERYFILDEERSVLKYWEFEQEINGAPRGELRVYGASGLEVGEKRYCISIQVGSSFEEWLALGTEEEQRVWLTCLKKSAENRKEDSFEPDDSLWDDVMKHPSWGLSMTTPSKSKKISSNYYEMNKKLDRASVFDYSAARSGWRVEVRYHIQAFASGLPEPWTARITHADLRQFLIVDLCRQDLLALLDKRHAAANPKRLLSPALLGRRVQLMNTVLDRLVKEHSQQLLDWLLQQRESSSQQREQHLWTSTYSALTGTQLPPTSASTTKKDNNNHSNTVFLPACKEKETDFFLTDHSHHTAEKDHHQADTETLGKRHAPLRKKKKNTVSSEQALLIAAQRALLATDARYCCGGLLLLAMAVSIEPRIHSPALLGLAALFGASLGAKLVELTTASEIDRHEIETEDYDLIQTEQTQKTSIDLPRWPSGDGRHCYSEPDAGFFRIRGPSYLEDKLKVASQAALFPLAGVDLFLTDVPQQHVARHPAALVQRNLRLNKDQPRTLVVNFCMPWGNLVGYWSLVSSSSRNRFPQSGQTFSSDDDDEEDDDDTQQQSLYDTDEAPVPKEDISRASTATDQEESDSTAALKVFQRFIEADDEYRDARLKLVPRVVDGGSWIVRRAVGAGVNAAKLSEAVKLAYYSDPHYFEIDVDIVGSPIARRILSVVRSATSTLVMDLALVIEATEHSELPERILGAVRLHRVNPEQAPTLSPFLGSGAASNAETSSQ